jgi:hypothetical protein
VKTLYYKQIFHNSACAAGCVASFMWKKITTKPDFSLPLFYIQNTVIEGLNQLQNLKLEEPRVSHWARYSIQNSALKATLGNGTDQIEIIRDNVTYKIINESYKKLCHIIIYI